jgi:hypothetical protein
VAKKSNIIELNGKRYDAFSGQLLDSTGAPIGPAVGRGVSMDGMVSGVKPAMVAGTSSVVKPAQNGRPISDMVRVPAKHAAPHKPTSSQTLMRHAVHKPAGSLKPKAHHRTDVLVKQPSIAVAPKMSSYKLDPKRVQRAQLTPHHPEARRYALDRRSLTPSAQPAGRPAAPVTQAAQPVALPVHADASAVPLRQPAKPQAHSIDIFERALAEANSHIARPLTRRQTRRRRQAVGSRALSIGTASLAVLLVVGFFGWQAKANLTMRYAAAKSGVAASLPGYKPSGFTAGKFTYSPGLVAVNYKNTRSGDNFAVIEKSSSWDSSALRDSFVASRSRTYQTIDAAGRTIYTYGSNNATWVNNGVWYQVNSNGSLSTNQLVQLALSM